jgi:chaperone required for assembly of F1-ATPase
MGEKGEDFATGFFVGPQERNPLRAAAQGARPRPIKRFYEKAAIEPAAAGFAVLLDGKSLRTPAGNPLTVPSRALAEALAAEWSGQEEAVNPASMPLTKLVNSAIDGVAERMAEVEADVVKYAGSDLICYRASEPESLVREQSALWDGLIAFARGKLHARLTLAEGVMFVAQPAEAIEAIARAVRRYVDDDAGSRFRLAALHTMTALTGSCVVALALALGEIDIDRAWAAANVDEDFELNAWGADEEALARRNRRFADMRAAAFTSGLWAHSG